MINRITYFLDRINFLGIKIWDFSIRSLSREYSWFFLFNIIFRHPIRSLRGFLAYKKFSQANQQISPLKIYQNISAGQLIYQAQNDRSGLLVAMGYCQRPLKTNDQPFNCPSERFNHDCYYLDHFNQSNKLPPACSGCDIKSVAELAINAGASFHIMTSAMDIARDIFLPILEQQRFNYTIMFVCPYSILPITLPLFICGIKFIIISYATGDCRNYRDFVRADVGIKPKRTFSLLQNHELVLDILKKMVQNKNQAMENFSILKKRHIYFTAKLK